MSKYCYSRLNFYIKKSNIRPIFVTQARYDGISTHRLYLVNKETKEWLLLYYIFDGSI